MAKFIIEGEQKLTGEITVAGNKNAALPIIAATVLTDEPCELTNIPEIRDVVAMLDLLKELGKTVEKHGANQYRVSGAVHKSKLDDQLAGNLRASILFLGALLARTGKVEMRPPGGCVLGRRNVDSHFTAITALGADLKMEENKYIAELLTTASSGYFPDRGLGYSHRKCHASGLRYRGRNRNPQCRLRTACDGSGACFGKNGCDDFRCRYRYA